MRRRASLLLGCPSRVRPAGIACALAVLLLAAGRAGAGPASDPREVARRVDQLVGQRLAEKKVPASPRAGDAEFVRRAYLDLTGRVPTADRAAAFLDDKAADKRAKLVDALLADPRYGHHFATVWVNLMTDEEMLFAQVTAPDTAPLHKWLADGFNANRPWDQTVRGLIAADGTVGDNPQAGFYRLNADFSGVPTPSLLAKSTARLFLGQQIGCVECHAHPFREVAQAEFWGLAAFYARLTIEKQVPPKGEAKDKKEKKPDTFIVRDAPAGFVIKSNNNGERKVLDSPAIAIPATAFKNVGKVVPARLPDGTTPALDMNRPFRPVLAGWVTSPQNPAFARAAVNRLWAHLMGRGIVHPVDDLHEENPPSHPELLAYLADEFARSGFDLKHLTRAIANSEAYQRTGAPVPGNEGASAEPLFARQRLKVWSADALLDSLCVVLEVDGAALFAAEAKARKGEEEDRKKRKLPAAPRDPWDASPRVRFLDLFRADEDDSSAYRHGIPQALRRLNDPTLAAGGTAAARLAKQSLPPAAAAERLYLAALARRPDAEERAEAAAFLADQPDPATGYARLLWVLMNGSEFALTP